MIPLQATSHWYAEEQAVKIKTLDDTLAGSDHWAFGVRAPQPSAPQSAVITLLHTNDEHGWILPAEKNKTTLTSGAAELMGVWQKNEGYPNASTIALSSGDMWTGPAISTWFMANQPPR